VHRDFWQNQQMNMVGHDYPCSEFVEASLLFANDDCFGYEAGNAGVVQPAGAGGVSMKGSIRGYESLSRGRVWLGG
jgi:hypothetical protein